MNAKKWIWLNIYFFDQSERAKSNIHFLGLYSLMIIKEGNKWQL